MLVLDNDNKIINNIEFIDGFTLPYPKRYNCGIFNSIVYYPTIPLINLRNDFKKFGEYKLISKVNLKTGKNEQIVNVPDDFYDYHSNTIFEISPEFVFPNDSTIVFIMRKSPDLYVYDTKTKKTKSYHFPDEKINYTEEDIRLAMNNIDYMWSKGFYRNLYYDNANKIYYRISVHPISHNADGSANIPVRVTAFDKEFNLLVKEDFKGLLPTFSFVNKNGLYIVEKGSPENSMRFRHIVLEKNTE